MKQLQSILNVSFLISIRLMSHVRTTALISLLIAVLIVSSSIEGPHLQVTWWSHSLLLIMFFLFFIDTPDGHSFYSRHFSYWLVSFDSLHSTSKAFHLCLLIETGSHYLIQNRIIFTNVHRIASFVIITINWFLVLFVPVFAINWKATVLVRILDRARHFIVGRFGHRPAHISPLSRTSHCVGNIGRIRVQLNRFSGTTLSGRVRYFFLKIIEIAHSSIQFCLV